MSTTVLFVTERSSYASDYVALLIYFTARVGRESEQYKYRITYLCRIKALLKAVMAPPPGSGGKYILMSSAMRIIELLEFDLLMARIIC
jgi:hypothetical protein